ncbi:MAG: biotin/lipoyl-containing protein [Anaerolineae bacterium]
MKYTAVVEGQEFEIEIGPEETVTVNGRQYDVDFRSIDGQHVYSLLLNNRSFEILAEGTKDTYEVLVEGERHEVQVYDERSKRLADLGDRVSGPRGNTLVKAPMPGLVISVTAQEGQRVKAGDGLIILEAMKMENELRAPWEGVVKKVQVVAGDTVDQGQVLAVIGPAE